MRFRWMMCVVFFLCGGVPPLEAGQECPRYDIRARVDFSQKEITASQQVSFVNRTDAPLTEAYFHLYPNHRYTNDEAAMLMRYAGYFKVDAYPSGFVQGEMPVHAVRQNGQELSFCVEGKDQTLLKVVLDEPLSPAASVVLDVDFSVKIPNAYGRFGWHDNIFKAAYWYPVLCAQTDKGWALKEFYPFHRPFHTDAALYDVALTLPEEMTVIHSGAAQQEERHDGFKTVVIKSEWPIRAFSFAASADYQWKESRYRDVRLRCYYLPGDEARAAEAVENLKEVFAFYEKRFGPYPYPEFSIAPVHLGYGGEQMAGMVLIDTRVFKLPRLLAREFDFLIAHEAGHQWFYNLVGVNGSEELWLEEAVNSYFSLAYMEEKYGYDAQILEFPEWFEPYTWLLPSVSFRRVRDYRYQQEARMGYDGPLAGPLADYDDPSRIFSLIYGKGVRVIEALREKIGDEAFLRVFKKAFERYRFQNWTGQDFIELCEEESGQDLASFVDQWVFSGGHCDYDIRVRGKEVKLIRHGNVIEPVEVRVVFSDGSREELKWDGQEKERVFSFAREVTQAVVDPREKLFDLDRTNNVWPRPVSLSFVPLYVGLYDMPLFLPDDAYQIVAGPEINNGIGVKASFQKPYEYVFYGGTDYRFGEDLWTSRAGVLKKNVLRSPVSVGAEVSRVKDLDTGREDLTGAKIYARRDFNVWPYGMFTLQDYAAVYLIRNQRPNADNEGLHSAQDDRNFEYRRKEETVIGASFHRDRSAPYPDPKQGYRMSLNAESGGHLLGGDQYFYRGSVDAALYQGMTPRTKIASRVKIGMGYPDDKDLFQLGGMDGLRGYQRKSLRGANAVLGVVEYRFPLAERLNYYALDNIAGLSRIDAAVFAEAGRVWFSSWAESEWKKDAGAGLRFHIDIGGFLEKVIVRVDAARAIDDSSERTRFWLSINSLF